MDKLKMHSPDLSQENIAKIRDLFPGCVTEARDEATGQLRLAVDFDQLRQELSDQVVEGPQERYRLDWPGKREALALANAPIAKALRPSRDESVDFDITRNLFIEGDNLEVLKLLQETYLGKVKMIYVDPPYNTGNDFVYEDNFVESPTEFLATSNQVDTAGNRLVANTQANGRFHSDWLSMIYPRLKLSRDLLCDDGVIFISIDDNEAHNLKKICDEVFGADCFRANIVWRRTVSGAVSGQGFSVSHDHILCYSKTSSTTLSRLDVEGDAGYKNPDNDPRGPYKTQKLERTLEGARPTMTFTIETPAGPITKTWAVSRPKFDELLSEKRVVFSASGTPYYKQFLSEYGGRLPETIWINDAGSNQEGSKELSALLGEKNIFTNPKPTRLILKALKIAAQEKNAIVLDFFAGSCATAHAVFRANAEQGLNIKFICVQLDEETPADSPARAAGYMDIPQISKERIRRAGKNILEGECHPDWNRDVGFRVLKLDTSNMQDVYYRPDQIDQKDLLAAVDNIKPDRTPEDLLFQVLVDWGGVLTAPIKQEMVQGKNIFFVNKSAYAGPDLIACFDIGITEELVKELATHLPVKVVFRDNGFVSDAVKINVEQIFRQVSPGTDVKSI
jgi:adenine-specific DNA-methyltransferase